MRAFTVGLSLAGLLFSISGCSPQSAPPSARPLSFPAPSYENLPAAPRDQLRQAWQTATQNPDDAPTVGRFGMMLLSYDQPQAAIAPLQRAGQLEAENFAWLYYQGMAQADAGHPAEALDVFKKAMAKKPNFVPLQLRIADALLASGRVADAEHACLAILLAHSDAIAAHRTLAGVYERYGNSSDAAKEKALTVGPVAKVPYLQDPWLDALHEWKPPEVKSPTSATRQIHFEKGRELLAKKRYSQAIEELKLTLIPEDRETPGYLLTISIAYHQARDEKNALESAQKAQQLAADQGQKELLPAIEAQLTTLAADESALAGSTGSTGKDKSATDKHR
jgi:tetratricopeptide (TPR) repeat protein